MFMTAPRDSLTLSGVGWSAFSAVETSGSLRIGSQPRVKAPKLTKKSFLRVCEVIT